MLHTGGLAEGARRTKVYSYSGCALTKGLPQPGGVGVRALGIEDGNAESHCCVLWEGSSGVVGKGR